MARWGVAIVAAVPFATLAGILRQLPDPWTDGAAMPWSHALGHAAVLAAAMGAHAACYALWQPHAPNRMLVNEFLTRMWFVLSGLALVGAHGDYGALFLIMAAPWAVASWCTHYLVLRREASYRADSNAALLGLFLVGLALMALVCVRLQMADDAAF